VSAVYVVRPKADQDLGKQAYYFATEAGPELGHRFLLAAHETFSMLARQPQIGWHARLKNPLLASLRVFRVSDFEKMLVLYRPSPQRVEILRVVHGSNESRMIFRSSDLECGSSAAAFLIDSHDSIFGEAQWKCCCAAAS